MANRIKVDEQIEQTNEQTDKVPSVTVDFKQVAIKDNSLVAININGKAVNVPKMYIDDKTAVAGGVNENGTLTFHRCKPYNESKYSSIKIDGVGTIRHNAQFGARLQAFKGGD